MDCVTHSVCVCVSPISPTFRPKNLLNHLERMLDLVYYILLAKGQCPKSTFVSFAHFNKVTFIPVNFHQLVSFCLRVEDVHMLHKDVVVKTLS